MEKIAKNRFQPAPDDEFLLVHKTYIIRLRGWDRAVDSDVKLQTQPSDLIWRW